MQHRETWPVNGSSKEHCYWASKRHITITCGDSAQLNGPLAIDSTFFTVQPRADLYLADENRGEESGIPGWHPGPEEGSIRD